MKRGFGHSQTFERWQDSPEGLACLGLIHANEYMALYGMTVDFTEPIPRAEYGEGEEYEKRKRARALRLAKLNGGSHDDDG